MLKTKQNIKMGGNVPRKTKGLENFVLVTQIGIAMATPIMIGLYIGKRLDEYLNKSPLFLLIFIVIGIIASFTNLFKLIEKSSGNQKRK